MITPILLRTRCHNEPDAEIPYAGISEGPSGNTTVLLAHAPQRLSRRCRPRHVFVVGQSSRKERRIDALGTTRTTVDGSSDGGQRAVTAVDALAGRKRQTLAAESPEPLARQLLGKRRELVASCGD